MQEHNSGKCRLLCSRCVWPFITQRCNEINHSTYSGGLFVYRCPHSGRNKDNRLVFQFGVIAPFACCLANVNAHTKGKKECWRRGLVHRLLLHFARSPSEWLNGGGSKPSSEPIRVCTDVTSRSDWIIHLEFLTNGWASKVRLCSDIASKTYRIASAVWLRGAPTLNCSVAVLPLFHATINIHVCRILLLVYLRLVRVPTSSSNNWLPVTRTSYQYNINWRNSFNCTKYRMKNYNLLWSELWFKWIVL